MGGEASKLGAVAASFQKLGKEDISPTEDAFWSALISASTKDALFTHITPETVRTLIKERPRNIGNLARKAVSKMVKAASSKGGLGAVEQQSVLNCAAILSRLLPVLFEGEREHHLVDTVFWKGDLPAAATGAAPATDGAAAATSPTVQEESQPLAAPLIDAILSLLFKQGFTCTGSGENIVWEGGMGPNGSSSAKSSQFDAARADMLKLLLVSCSETLYVTPGARCREADEYKAAENRWLSYYTTRSKEASERLFLSLCNVIFTYDPVGYGIPYSSSLLSDPRESVVDAALQTLIVVLDYSAPAAAAAAPAATDPQVVRRVPHSA